MKDIYIVTFIINNLRVLAFDSSRNAQKTLPLGLTHETPAAPNLEVQHFDLGLCCMGKRFEQLSLSERVYIQAQLEMGFKARARASNGTDPSMLPPMRMGMRQERP